MEGLHEKDVGIKQKNKKTHRHRKSKEREREGRGVPGFWGASGRFGARGALGSARGPDACLGQKVSRGLVARGELALPGAPDSAGLGRAAVAAGARRAGCLPGLACQQGGGWQLERRGRALPGGGNRLADRSGSGGPARCQAWAGGVRGGVLGPGEGAQCGGGGGVPRWGWWGACSNSG